MQRLKKKAMLAALAIVPALTTGAINYIEGKAAAKEAKREGTENTLTSVTPAITELQRFVIEGQREHVALSKELDNARKAIISISKEVQYCKAYVDLEMRGRRKLSTEDIEKSPALARLEEGLKPVVSNTKRPKARIPNTAQQAQRYKKARESLKCSAKDPTCGASVLK